MKKIFMKKNNYLKAISLLIFSSCLLVLMSCGRIDGNLRLGIDGKNSVSKDLSSSLVKLNENEKKGKALIVRSAIDGNAVLRLLNDDLFSFALVPADILSDSFNNNGEFKEDDDLINYGVVAGLVEETCHIIVPMQSSIKSIRDFIGKSVSVGNKNTDTFDDAEQVLSEYGVDLDEFTPLYLNEDESIEALKNGSIDGAFITTTLPSDKIAKLCSQMDVRFLSLKHKDLENIRNDNDGYKEVVIKENTYEGQESPITVFGTHLVLVANLDVADATVEKLTKLILNKFYLNNLESDHPDYKASLEKSLAQATLKGTKLPFHKGAMKVYREYGLSLNFSDRKSGIMHQLKSME